MLNYMENPAPTTYYTMTTGSTTWSDGNYVWIQPLINTKIFESGEIYQPIPQQSEPQMVKCPFCGSRQKRSNGDCPKCGGDLLNDRV